jgi:hypothetical protein
LGRKTAENGKRKSEVAERKLKEKVEGGGINYEKRN